MWADRPFLRASGLPWSPGGGVVALFTMTATGTAGPKEGRGGHGALGATEMDLLGGEHSSEGIAHGSSTQGCGERSQGRGPCSQTSREGTKGAERPARSRLCFLMTAEGSPLTFPSFLLLFPPGHPLIHLS